MFDAKEVPYELLGLLSRDRERAFHGQGWAAVVQAVRGEVLPFDLYFEFVCSNAAVLSVRRTREGGMGAQTAVRLHGKYCGECGGKLIDVAAESCPRCQASFGVRESARSRSRIAAALLAFLFGGAGAHRFYLGQSGLGLLYVLFAWTLIPGLVSFVDFIRFLAMSDERFAAVYGRRTGGGGKVTAGAIAGAMIVYGIIGALVLPGILEAARTAGASLP